MSLISEALKKAQAQQQGQPSPHANAPAPTDAAVRASPPPLAASLPAGESKVSASKPLVLLAVAAIAFVFMLGGGLIVWGVLNLSKSTLDGTALTIATDNPAPPVPASAPQTAASEPANASADLPSPDTSLTPITFNVEEPAAALATAPTAAAQPAQASVAAVVAPSPTPAPDAQAPRPEPVAGLPTPSAISAAPAPPPATPPEQRPEVRQRIANLEIRGIMRGGGKVLLYDAQIQRSRAFSSGDDVDTDLGITIFSISSNQLTFIDEEGARYLKRF